ncbi:MAG: thermonuclease family protein [Pseudomonadota bacterium]
MSLAGCIALLACALVSIGAIGQGGAITVASASDRSPQSSRMIQGPVRAQVLRVVDGDTIRVRAQIWIGQHIEVSVRLAKVDAAELNSRCREARRLAFAAKSHVHGLLAGTVVQLHDVRSGKYAGRVVADVVDREGRSVSRTLLDAGLAVPMSGTHANRRNRFCAKKIASARRERRN